jgi:electron transfer flavoprotein alpha/beta subunit
VPLRNIEHPLCDLRETSKEMFNLSKIVTTLSYIDVHRYSRRVNARKAKRKSCSAKLVAKIVLARQRCCSQRVRVKDVGANTSLYRGDIIKTRIDRIATET